MRPSRDSRYTHDAGTPSSRATSRAVSSGEPSNPAWSRGLIAPAGARVVVGTSSSPGPLELCAEPVARAPGRAREGQRQVNPGQHCAAVQVRELGLAVAPLVQEQVKQQLVACP